MKDALFILTTLLSILFLPWGYVLILALSVYVLLPLSSYWLLFFGLFYDMVYGFSAVFELSIPAGLTFALIVIAVHQLLRPYLDL